METCTRIACYLEGKGELVNFPLVTIAGLVDGINPCAIGMMVTLLGYLIVFGSPIKSKIINHKSKIEIKNNNRRILRIGLAYIASVFVTYLIIGLAFYTTVSQIQQIAGGVVNKVIGVVLGIAGAIMLKDVVWPESPIHLRIPGVSREKLMKLIEKVSVPAAILLGIAVTVLETPCSLPLYVGTATVLSNSGMPLPVVVGYFLYYNLLFVLPLIIILVLMLKGKKIVEMREWEHKAEKWMKLVLGILLIGFAAWLFYY
jgi:cytochrome c biogenesis protein CcdA